MKKMRRIFFVFILLVSICPLVKAQFTIGPKLGYTSSYLTTDLPKIKEDLSNTFHFGFFLRAGSKFYFQSEMLYTAKGGKLTGIYGSNESKLEQLIEISTIDFPFLLGYSLVQSKSKKTNIRVFLGPELSLFTDKKIVISPIEVSNMLNEEDFKDKQWGIQTGIGFDLSMLSIDARYEYGFGDITTDSNDYKLKNHLFLVSVGVKIL